MLLLFSQAAGIRCRYYRSSLHDVGIQARLVSGLFEGFSFLPKRQGCSRLKQGPFVLNSSFYLPLCLSFSFSSYLIVLVEVSRVQGVGSSEEVGASAEGGFVRCGRLYQRASRVGG